MEDEVLFRLEPSEELGRREERYAKVGVYVLLVCMCVVSVVFAVQGMLAVAALWIAFYCVPFTIMYLIVSNRSGTWTDGMPRFLVTANEFVAVYGDKESRVRLADFASVDPSVWSQYWLRRPRIKLRKKPGSGFRRLFPGALRFRIWPGYYAGPGNGCYDKEEVDVFLARLLLAVREAGSTETDGGE